MLANCCDDANVEVEVLAGANTTQIISLKQTDGLIQILNSKKTSSSHLTSQAIDKNKVEDHQRD